MSKSILTKESKEFLYKYLNASAPTGFETEGQKIWLDYITPYVDETFVDNYGTAVGVINPNAPFKVVIEAHADEISWFVNYITDDGYIYIKRNGGSDHQIAPSKRVRIHGEQGIVEGVFGWPAIHVRNSGKEETPTLKNIFVDIGCSTKEEVEAKGVHVGSVITYPDELTELNDKFYTGRALDNRMGGFMIAEVARLLSGQKPTLPYGLYIVNSVQEEVGLHGAKMITDTIKPNVAIVTDVCHDTSHPMMNKIQEGDTKCGLGPVLTTGPAVQNNLLKLIKDVSVVENIDFQRMAASGGTGTDTDAFAFSNGGVPSALISLALKYMHTTVETVDKGDVENVIKLIYHSLQKIENNHDFKYIKL